MVVSQNINCFIRNCHYSTHTFTSSASKRRHLLLPYSHLISRKIMNHILRVFNFAILRDLYFREFVGSFRFYEYYQIFSKSRDLILVKLSVNLNFRVTCY